MSLHNDAIMREHLTTPIRICPIRTRCRVRTVDHALRTQSAPIGIYQVPRPIEEPSITLHIRHCVQPRQRLLKKRLCLSVCPSIVFHAEFSHPYRLLEYGIRTLHVVLQVAKGISIAVPMQVDKVELAPRTVAHELLQPFNAAAIGDGWRSDSHSTRERHHGTLVGCHAAIDRHASRARVGCT